MAEPSTRGQVIGLKEVRFASHMGRSQWKDAGLPKVKAARLQPARLLQCTHALCLTWASLWVCTRAFASVSHVATLHACIEFAITKSCHCTHAATLKPLFSHYSRSLEHQWQHHSQRKLASTAVPETCKLAWRLQWIAVHQSWPYFSSGSSQNGQVLIYSAFNCLFRSQFGYDQKKNKNNRGLRT